MSRDFISYDQNILTYLQYVFGVSSQRTMYTIVTLIKLIDNLVYHSIICVDQFSEIFFQRAFPIYHWCLHIDGHKFIHTLHMSLIS